MRSSYIRALDISEARSRTRRMQGLPRTRNLKPSQTSNGHNDHLVRTEYCEHVSQMMSRTLSYEADILNAMLGIFGALYRSDKDHLFRVWGVALQHRPVAIAEFLSFPQCLYWKRSYRSMVRRPGFRAGHGRDGVPKNDLKSHQQRFP